MSQKNIVSKEDIFIKARIISEGVHLLGNSEEILPEIDIRSMDEEKGDSREIKIPEKLDFTKPEKILELYSRTILQKYSKLSFGHMFVFKDSNLLAPIYLNKHSRLDLNVEGETATVFDGGKELVTGLLPKTPEWLNGELSNGLPIKTFLPGMSHNIINILFSISCMNYNTNRGCRFCNLFANPVSRKIHMLPLNVLQEYARYQAEAVQIATDNGWRGNLAICGGSLAPAQRGEYLERIKIVLTILREYLGEKTLSELHLVYNHYPPEDLSDMYKWKEIGIDATSIDIEVMDPAYFAAICPGKNAYKPLTYWKKAQEKSVEVFGPILGTTGCVVMGIEPMSTLLKGVEERISKGIMPLPLVFWSAPDSAYWGFRAPTAEWIVEASEKIAGFFMKYILQFLPTITKNIKGKRTSGMLKANQTSHLTVVFDEIQRQVQETFGSKVLGNIFS